MQLATLRNPIQPYAWGCPRSIPELLGVPNPDGGPQAELWMGAHERAPSLALVDGRWRSLREWIAEEPSAVLGEAAAARFGVELPFLFKVLAAARPLSIQAHPSAAQAREGFAREEARGVPRDAPTRSYRDPNPKPEILCALTRFEALQGFRDAGEAAALLGSVPCADLDAPRARLREQGLRGFVGALLRLSGEARRAAAAAAGAAAAARRGEPTWDRVAALAAAFPGDAGALAPLFLREVVLEPGEAVFLGPGELHAYLSGTGVELMANSDNVLRGGLTDKHVDAGELLRVLAFPEAAPSRVRAAERRPGEWVYATAAEQFELARLEVSPGRPFDAPAQRGVEILLCTAGAVEASCGGAALPLARGASALAPAAAGAYRLAGEGVVHRAAVPGAAT